MSIKIIAKVHPFDAKKRIIKETEPKPLYSLYEELNIGLPIEHAHFLIEDEIIKDINKIPDEGQTVYIAVHPGGTPEGTGKGMAIGGFLSIVAGILVTAISGGTLAGVGVALIGTGVGMLAGGAVLLNLDIPTLKDRERPKQNPSIRGAKNRANQLGFIPVVLGRHLIYPDLAANPYFEIEGNDQYLIQLFCAGYNDIEIEKESIKLGDTLLKEYSETKDIDKILAGEDSVVKLQILKSGEECSFYKRAVRDENINQILKNRFEDGKDGSIIRTTPSKTTKINVDIFFYSGLGKYNDKGDVVSTSVEVACYYKREAAPDSEYSLLGFFNGDKNLIEGSDLKTKRFQITKEGLTPDKYTLKFTRLTSDSEDNKIVDAVYVGSIRSFTDDRPIRFERQKNLTIVALKIKATERLNGVIDSLNFIAQSKIPSYKGSGSGPDAWEERLTSNPAAILKYVLQGKINSNPVSNEDIDWQSFEAWALWCDEKKYFCNAVLSEKATLSELITMITHTARADAVKIDSKFSVVQDVERVSPVQLFTPRNTKAYSQSLLFAEGPEAIEFNFIDEESGFKENERIVYNTSTGETGEGEALKKQQVRLWGVTNATQAFKIGRYQYACMHNRPRVHKIDVDLEFLVCTKGDRIQYAGDTGLIGIAYGRVKGLETLNGLTTAVILDEYIEAEKGRTYALRFRKKDGRILIADTRPLTESYTNKIEFEVALNADASPQEGDLFTFGIKEKECLDLIITSIEPTDEWNASIIAVDYAPEIFGIDDPSYVVPPFDNKITNIDGSISDSGSVEQWKYYYTYNDSEEEPLRPKGDGTKDGWHRLQTKKSIWVSIKNAININEGQWSAPVRLKGEKGEPGSPGETVSFPPDTDLLDTLNFDESAQSLPAPDPSFTVWQSKIIEYDCTDKQEIKMTFEEALNNVIILSGELKNDFKLKLFFNKQNGNGAKQYLIVYKLTGNFNVTIETEYSGTNKISQNINTETFGLGCYAVVDFKGNVWHFKGEKGQGGGLNNLDIAGSFDDENYFLIEKDNEIKKLNKQNGFLAIQKNDSPIGEVKIFYENGYKHGFLEANGLPFSPDVFPEFEAYVKKYFNTEIDNITGWQLRPKIIKNDGTFIFLKAVQGV
ncbi:hypothetical protein E4O05_01425 [Treponema sp. OMZ 787]|uniref:host specificity factor TipJ family phage tail protein n=1 Tax=Treponema sp. OMZ 787 TaxID=2563669 RepID=UPI0020A3838A|nr:host specificity factor TipJ family phage tail protein [Treponema sp. OMZ 787]UTC62603.1 hypothetical protein E4O05_01425 [Treponema sp. OMZ 787]